MAEARPLWKFPAIPWKTFDERAALWRRYKLDRADVLARRQLELAYFPLVRYVSRRMATGVPAPVHETDLIAYGHIGLSNAIDRFDPDGESLFEAVAIARVKNAIIDELAALDWVPRSVRVRAREIERSRRKLGHRLHRAPTDDEMAVEQGVSLPSLEELWAVPHSPGEHPTRFDALRSRYADRLAHAVAALPRHAKLVIALRYDETMTLRDIGEVVGLPESRVSRLHRSALLRLSAGLEGARPPA